MSFRKPKFRLLRNCTVFNRAIDNDADDEDADANTTTGHYIDMKQRGKMGGDANSSNS